MQAYYEVQRFPGWVWLPVAGLGLFLLVVAWRRPALGMAARWAPTAILLLVALVLGSLRLETQLDSNGIHYRMPPLVNSRRHIPWAEVRAAEVVQYRPLRDYGGWGIRLGRKGWAYNIRGNWGLSLKLKSGRRLLLGTSQPEALRAALAAWRPATRT